MKAMKSHPALWIAFAMSALPAAATTMWKSDVTELARSSASVVRGTVQNIQSHWTGDHMRIVTDVDIAVTETLKGEPARTVRVTQPGGQVGHLGQSVEGIAAFAQGEDVVVFLTPAGSRQFALSGMAQGKYSISRAADQKTLLAVPERSGAVMLDRTTRAPMAMTPAPLALDTLREKVRLSDAARPKPSTRITP